VVTLAAGCSSARKDATLATNIKAAMFSDSHLKNADVDVSVAHGVVTLKGSVASGDLRVQAEKVASEAGAKMLDDEITIQTPENAPLAAAITNAPPPTTDEKPSRKPAAATIAKKSKAETKTKPAKAQQAAVVTSTSQASYAAPAPAAAQDASSTPTPAPAPATQSAVPQNPTPVAAQQAAAQTAAAATPAAAAPEPKDIQVPAGSALTVRMIDGIDSSVNHTGEIFHASLDTPILVDNDVIVPRGADVYIRLTGASQSGTMKGKSELHLELVKMDFQGRSYSLVSSTYSLSGKPRGQDTAKKVGGGAVLGTLIGAIAGGGKGAAIGAAVGAAGGGIYQSSTKPQPLKVPAETKLDFKLEQPVDITVQPHNETANNAGNGG